MSQFFVLTDQAVLGPLTGVELRESALAGVLAPDCIVGGSKQGPWHSADQVGLFSDKKVPIPHPKDVSIPTYHVRGMPGAFQGPFKLRELIGFASRGMLPIDAELCLVHDTCEASSGQETWCKASQFRVLLMCLEGDLVMLDTDDRIHLRTRGVIDGADASRWTDQFRAPIETIRRIDASDVTTFATTGQLSGEDGRAEKMRDALLAEDALSAVMPGIDENQSLDERRSRGAFAAASITLIQFTHAVVRSRLAIASLLLCLAILVVQKGWLVSGPQVMTRDAVLGQWIANSDNGQPPRFGIAFRADGTCTIFNMIGDSWTGDYQWSARRPTTAGHGGASAPQPVIRSTVDYREPNHLSGFIQEGDGYLSLSGFAQRGAMIDGHPVQDLFVRRTGDQLKLGYLTEIAWDSGGKKLSAGWVNANLVDGMQSADVVAMLREMASDVESATPASGPNLNEALVSIVSENSSPHESMLESPVQSPSVDPEYLLTNFGVPDEARKIYGFEVPADSKGKSFEANHLVRYGNLVLMMTGEGDLQYVRYLRNVRDSETGNSPAT